MPPRPPIVVPFLITPYDAAIARPIAAERSAENCLFFEAPARRQHAQAIKSRRDSMLGPQLAQAPDLGLSGSDFQRLAARLSLLVDSFEIEQNGWAFNNLIFMAVALSELAERYLDVTRAERWVYNHPCRRSRSNSGVAHQW